MNLPGPPRWGVGGVGWEEGKIAEDLFLEMMVVLYIDGGKLLRWRNRNGDG